MRMIGVCLGLFGLLIGAASAQEETLKDLIDKGAKRVSKVELMSLVPGSKHVSRGQTGSYRQWTHYADGTLMGDVKTQFPGTTGKGHGKWSVNDAGQYCVDIKRGQPGAEKWCRSTFRLGDDYYGVPDSRKTDAKPFK